MDSVDPAYEGKNALVTGGLGFIGSTLAHRLVAARARVLLLDALLPDGGGNPYNIEAIRDRVTVRIADVREREVVDSMVRGMDVIFNLAGTASHTDSMVDPWTDLDINCRAQVSILEACRHHNPGVKIVFAGTRGQYGKPEYLPVDEKHPLRAEDANGINKTAGESYHLLYHEHYGIRATSLRMSNTYGPRHQMRHHRQGVICWFVRQAIDGQTIRVFGDGRQLRDTNYVDDVVDALVRAGASAAADGEVFNLGSTPIGLADLAAMIVRAAGTGRYELCEYPETSRRVEVGDYVADTAKIERLLGWRAAVPLEEGVARTVEFYRREKSHYW